MSATEFTLILIDGRRQNAAGDVTPNGFGDSSTSFMPPPSAIERIEVIRGPMSTLYGSDAMGGVINIITRKVGKAWAGSVTVDGTINEYKEYGNSSSASIYLNGPIKTDLLGLQIRAKKYHRDGSNIQFPGKTALTTGSDPTKADIENFGARLTLTPNKDHEISLDVDQTRQTYDNRRGQIGTLDSATVFRGYKPELEFNRDQVVLAHTWRMGNSILESSLTHNKTETVGRSIPDNTPGKISGAPRVLETENTILDTKLVTSIGNNMLSVGAQWWEGEMEDGVAVSKYTQKQIGIFAENEWRMREDLALTVGVRHDDHNTFGGATTPRAYLVWNANDQLTLKGGVSKAYRTPSLNQLADGITGYTSQGTRATYGNPTLTPERSVSSEIGAYFDSLSGFRTNITYFQTNLRDAIGSEDYTPAGGLIGTRPFNVDEANIEGVEVGTSLEFAENWKISANYTHTDSKQKTGADIGKPLNNTPKHMFNTKLDWKATQKLNLWAQASYNSERYRSEDTGAFTNTKKLLGNYKAYSLVNVGANYKVNNSWTMNMAINNLFDKNFAQYKPVTTTTGTPPRAVSGFANEYIGNFERRRLWLSANYTF
jgi:outer membrane receptor for ferrienterochelin and colicins